MAKITNLLFDLGEVLIPIDFEATLSLLKPHGISQHSGYAILQREATFFHDYQTGKMGDDAFRKGLCQIIGKQLNDSEIDSVWCAMLGTFPQEKVTLLQELAQSYHIYLFSNTNAIHVKQIEQHFSNHYGFSIKKLFKKVYYSHEIQRAKPDPEAFRYVLEDAGIMAEETCFFDDLPENIAGAKSIGLHTQLITNREIKLIDLV